MAILVGDTGNLDFTFRRADTGALFAPSGAINVTLVSPAGAVTVAAATQVTGTMVFRRQFVFTAAGTWLAQADTVDAAASQPVTEWLAIDVDPANTGDPLASTVPGSYVSGSAGYALGLIAAIKARTDLISPGSIVVLPNYLPRSGQLFMYRGDTAPVVISSLAGGLLGATNGRFSIQKAGVNDGDQAPATSVTATVVDNTTATFTPTSGMYAALDPTEEYVCDLRFTLATGGVYSPIRRAKLILIENVGVSS